MSGGSRRAFIAGLAATSVALMTTPARAAAKPALLLRGADHIVTMRGPALAGADVLIADGAIRAVGMNLAAEGADVLDMRGRVIAPGFVDTHWHMWNTAARGLARSPRGGFAKTTAAIAPHFTPADHAAGVRLALAEAIDAGITTVHNWAHNRRSPDHAEAELAAMVASGLRGRYAYGYAQDAARDATMDLSHLATLARTVPSPLISLGICARGPDRSDDPVWQAEWDAARRLNLPISTHMASDAAAAAGRGIARLAARDGLGRDVQLVHLTAADDDAMTTVAQAGSPVSISPWTELEVGYGVPPMARLAAAGLTIGLSVDNMVLAGQADMFSVLRLAADLAAGQARAQDDVSGDTALRWATADGARSLGMGDRVGTIAPGMRADVIAVRTDLLGVSPVSDPIALMTHAARPAAVDLVLVDGVIHKKDGRLTRVDADALRADAARSITRIRHAAGV